MQCPSCGETIRNNAKFCEYCGYSLRRGQWLDLENKRLVGVVIIAISLVLAIVAVFGPWLHANVYYQGWGISGDMDFKLWEVKGGGYSLLGSMPFTKSYSDPEVWKDMPYSIAVFYVTLILVIFSILLLFSSLLSFTKKSSTEKMRKITAAVVLTILTPIFFMVAFPIADDFNPEDEDAQTSEGIGFLLWWSGKIREEDSFYGSDTYEASHGAGWAWYVFIVAGILGITGRNTILKSITFTKPSIKRKVDQTNKGVDYPKDKCPSCEKRVEEDWIICSNCGEKL